MFGMKNIKPASIIISALLGGTLVFSGCGGDGGGKKNKTAATTETNPYEGSATLTGSVSLSGLSSEDSALLSSSSASNQSKRITAAGDAVVKLFVLDESGDLEDTEIECTISENSYTCPNIADDQEYIVRYIKDIGNGKILEMKSSATVASGATSAEAKVDPVTTMVTEAIMDAVIEAITGIVSDTDLVKEIIASVKTAVETTVKSLIQTGVIEVPSLVAEGDFDDFVTEEGENEGLSEVSGAVLTDDTITSTLDAAKSEVKGASLANLTNREKVKMIFDQMFADKGGGAAGWMTDFIGDKWDDVDSTMTVGWLTNMMLESMEVREDELYWILKMDQGDQLPAWVSTMTGEIETAVTAGLQNADTGSALAGAISAISEYHRIKGLAIADRNASDKEYLADFPSIVGELFPADYIDQLEANGLDTPFQNSGQITTYIIYLVDIYSSDVAGPIVDQYFTDNNVEVFGDMKEQIHLVDMSPESLFEELGFMDVAEDYYGLYFEGWFDIRTDRYWDQDLNEGMGADVSVLKIETSMENPEWFMTCDANLSADDFTATLTYPTASGTQDVAMDVTVESEVTAADEHCPNGGKEYSVRLMVGPNWDGVDCSSGPCEPVVNVAISDHVTGDYVITVTHDGETATKTIEDVFILNNPNDYRPKLVSPKGYPIWPGDNATQEELDAYHVEETAFWQEGITVMSPNTDTDGDGINDSLTDALFKWKAPDLSALGLPDNVVARYQVGINLFEPDSNGDGNVTQEERDNCNMNWDECNTEIFNTWWNNRAIKGTSFTLPVELPVNSNEGEYNVNVNLVFIDKATGREMTPGGNAWANFKVGTVEVLEDNASINFTGSVTLDSGNALPEWVDETKLKVALIAESNSYNETDDIWEWTTDVLDIADATVGGTYELNTTVGVIKTAMGENKWFNLIVFEDIDGDGQWQPWTPEADADPSIEPEPAHWMENRWFWFENWGEFRVGSDGEGYEFKSQKVTNEGVTVENMNFKNPFIWEGDFANEPVPE